MTDYKKFDELVSDIKFAGNLSAPEASGFYALHCPVCGKKPKKTGGFRFEGDSIIYNCFRGSCDATCVYTLGEFVSKKFKNLMSCMNVRIPVELSIKKSSLADSIKRELEAELYTEPDFVSVKRPDCSMSLLAGETDDISLEWQRYFDDRKVPLDGIYIVESGEYRNSCYIPFKLGNKEIGGQYITKTGYIANNGGNENIFYAPYGLYHNTIFVVEGGMDAKCAPQTFATLRDRITKEQAFFLRGKRVIMIPDRKGGNKFIDQFYKYGWELCVPPWDEKDLNSAVKRYGLPSCFRMIMDNLYDNKLKAKAAFNLWRIDE